MHRLLVAGCRAQPTNTVLYCTIRRSVRRYAARCLQAALEKQCAGCYFSELAASPALLASLKVSQQAHQAHWNALKYAGPAARLAEPLRCAALRDAVQEGAPLSSQQPAGNFYRRPWKILLRRTSSSFVKSSKEASAVTEFTVGSPGLFPARIRSMEGVATSVDADLRQASLTASRLRLSTIFSSSASWSSPSGMGTPSAARPEDVEKEYLITISW